ncbi:hypothetical protein PNEG_01129 [Pneumocystis murina B123]|uniref:Uncharacterized protein n=1 Tax=Pneumocystis murina (strain B123) TaxID=1069680 RepID=M7PIY7_PNEMU|nr:hypothetical protein PNEG_01129 [Pneumocystis murina B123]EMR10414.1 hypothetical protein PNEG_01129 [Pneumocystis murina B123]
MCISNKWMGHKEELFSVNYGDTIAHVGCNTMLRVESKVIRLFSPGLTRYLRHITVFSNNAEYRKIHKGVHYILTLVEETEVEAFSLLMEVLHDPTTFSWKTEFHSVLRMAAKYEVSEPIVGFSLAYCMKFYKQPQADPLMLLHASFFCKDDDVFTDALLLVLKKLDLYRNSKSFKKLPCYLGFQIMSMSESLFREYTCLSDFSNNDNWPDCEIELCTEKFRYACKNLFDSFALPAVICWDGDLLSEWYNKSDEEIIESIGVWEMPFAADPEHIRQCRDNWAKALKSNAKWLNRKLKGQLHDTSISSLLQK